jgi:hypothetical protein
MPRVGDSDFVLTFSGRRPLNHFGKVKLALDAHTKLAVPFTFHDLRRTAVSGLARLGVELPVVERVINHQSGTFRGVVGVYQRHDFAAEKRAALQRWADYVEGLVSGAPASAVADLGAVRRARAGA